jgi:putative flippase GtrA
MIRKLIHQSIFRYGVAAAIATSVDVVVYFLTFNYVLKKADWHVFAPLVISAPTISLAVSYSCGLITNFTLTKFFVFPGSDLRTRHQLMRYVLVALVVLGLNYLIMSFLIKGLAWFPTIARATSAIIAGFASFTAHRVFSFRGNDVVNKNNQSFL